MLVPPFLRPKTPEKRRRKDPLLPTRPALPPNPAVVRQNAGRSARREKRAGKGRLRLSAADRSAWAASPQKTKRDRAERCPESPLFRGPARRGRVFLKVRDRGYAAPKPVVQKTGCAYLSLRKRQLSSAALRRFALCGQTEETAFVIVRRKPAPYGRPRTQHLFSDDFSAAMPRSSENTGSLSRSRCAVDPHKTATEPVEHSDRRTVATPFPFSYWSGPPARIRKAARSPHASRVPQNAHSAPEVRRFPSTADDSRPPVPDAHLPDDPVSFPAEDSENRTPVPPKCRRPHIPPQRPSRRMNLSWGRIPSEAIPDEPQFLNRFLVQRQYWADFHSVHKSRAIPCLCRDHVKMPPEICCLARILYVLRVCS